jgi:hypothetical protein
MPGTRHMHRRAAVVGVAAGLAALTPAPADAGVAVVIHGAGRVSPGERLTYRLDFRHAYDPRALNGIAPGDHVSITLVPPVCEQFCVVRRLSRGLDVPRRGKMRFRFRFPREYTVCAKATAGPGSACRRVAWQSGDRAILDITVHGFSDRCPLGACRRSGSKRLVVR